MTILAAETYHVASPAAQARIETPRPTTRPVETSAESTLNTSDDQRRRASQNNSDTPSPSPRPPGTDPALPPQTIFDASLIGPDFKPQTKLDVEPVSAPADLSPKDAPEASGPASEKPTLSDSEVSTPAASASASEGPAAVEPELSPIAQAFLTEASGPATYRG